MTAARLESFGNLLEKNQTGLSQVELLIVPAVFRILAAVVIPLFLCSRTLQTKFLPLTALAANKFSCTREFA